MNDNIHFYEKQRFTQWWIWLLLICLVCLAPAGKFITYYNQNHSSDYKLDFYTIFFSAIAGILVIVLFFVMCLETRIDAMGIHVRFFPFHLSFRTYAWGTIESATVRKYSPLLEYGGWGIRGLRSNRAMNVKGNQGLQVVFKSGHRLLIGTQVAEEIQKNIPNVLLN